jgi:hypothetical protein
MTESETAYLFDFGSEETRRYPLLERYARKSAGLGLFGLASWKDSRGRYLRDARDECWPRCNTRRIAHTAVQISRPHTSWLMRGKTKALPSIPRISECTTSCTSAETTEWLS